VFKDWYCEPIEFYHVKIDNLNAIHEGGIVKENAKSLSLLCYHGCTPHITYNNVKNLTMKTGDYLRVSPNNKTHIIYASKVTS